ncbi:MAG: tetratricopeptide repeat protein [Planctomycetota bacterium]|nr:MAG: tetratricopeptide repeat protein [Planctomycetota bacterium]
MIYAAARAALENQPDSPALHVHAAAAALRMGDSPTAERLLERAVKLAPDDPRAWLLFAEASVIRNRPALARRCAQRARALGAPSPATRGS